MVEAGPPNGAALRSRGQACQQEESMTVTSNIGGIIHTYQKYDPLHFPSPTAPPPDLVSPAMEHLLHYGSMRHFSPEELAKMVKIDASQIAGLMPGLDYLRQKLLDRKKRIL